MIWESGCLCCVQHRHKKEIPWEEGVGKEGLGVSGGPQSSMFTQNLKSLVSAISKI